MVSVTDSSAPAICRAKRCVFRMLTTDLFTRERLCSRTVTSRSRCSFPMSGIIDSAISSRIFQLVNESSLTVTDPSFELGSAHMITTPFMGPLEGVSEAGDASGRVKTGGGAAETRVARCNCPPACPRSTP